MQKPDVCKPGPVLRRAAAVTSLSAALALGAGADLLAQGRQTGAVRGTAVDAQGLVLPGVTVTASSDALQGVRVTVTGPNGNYQIIALPPGDYLVRFEIAGFESVEQAATVGLGGDVGVNAALAPAGVAETVEVVGVVPIPLETTEISANLAAEEINALPIGRNLFRLAEMQPGLTDNSPNDGQLVINGAFAYDNVYLVDGVDVNDNLFSTANNLFIEDAVEETQVLTSGISAEYGRFSGGVVNTITKSGGNDFSGSYRLNLYKPSWTSVTPFERRNGVTERPGDLWDNETHEVTAGGPVLRNRLWFFYAGRFDQTDQQETFSETGIPYTRTSGNNRNQIKLTGTVAPGHTLSGSYMRNPVALGRPTFAFSIDPRTFVDSERANDLFVATWRGAVTDDLFAEVQFSQKRFGFRDSGGTSLDIFDSPFITLTQALGHYNAPYFDATDPEDRNNRQIHGNVTWFVETPTLGTHSIKGGFERYTSTTVGGNSQSSTGYVFDADYAVGATGAPLLDANGRLIPVFVPGASLIENWLPERGARIDINTLSFYVNDDWAFGDHLALNLGVRGEVVDSEASGGITTVDTGSIVPRLGVAYDPVGDGRYTVQATYSHYAGRYNDSQFANNTNVGNPSLLYGIYTGPAGRGLDFAPGFDPDNYRTVLAIFPTENVANDPALKSPITKEFTVSGGAALGDRGHVKGTYVLRRAGNFIEDFQDLTTGVTDIFHEGRNWGTFVNQVYRNTDLLERRYDALQFDGRYQVTPRFLVDGSYTVQLRNEGNFAGEAANQPAISSNAFDWPEITPADRYFPLGRLPSFQRHKARLWGIHHFDLGYYGSVDLGGVWRYNSGQVYSIASSGVPINATQQGIIDELGYPESGPSSRAIYYSEGRGSETFEGYGLFDLSVQYQIPVWRTLRPWLKFELYNVFNNDKLISWDTTVQPNADGPLDALGIPTTYTEGSRNGQGTSEGDYPGWLPGTSGGRTFRMALGFRF